MSHRDDKSAEDLEVLMGRRLALRKRRSSVVAKYLLRRVDFEALQKDTYTEDSDPTASSMDINDPDINFLPEIPENMDSDSSEESVIRFPNASERIKKAKRGRVLLERLHLSNTDSH